MNTIPFRHVVAGHRRATPSAPKVQPPAQQPMSECGSGWYHDAAIQESQQAPARKH